MAKKLNAETKRKPISNDQPGQSEDMVFDTPREQFERMLKGVRETLQGCSDATTLNATEWKGCKSAGINNGALKQAIKIDKMSEDKRADYLRALNAYCDWFKRFGGWEDQLDLVDAVQESENREALAIGQGYLAGKSGVNADQNPYPENDKANDTWSDGWDLGQATLMAASPLTNPEVQSEVATH